MTDQTYQDRNDDDRLQVGTDDDHAVYLAHVRGGIAHSVYLDRESVTHLYYQLGAWLNQAGAPVEAAPVEAELPTVTAEAEAAVYGDRQADYGHPREDFTRTAIIWTGLLQHKLADGEYIEAEDVPRCMIGVKLARDVNHPKRDNRVDGAGYFLTLDRLETGR